MQIRFKQIDWKLEKGDLVLSRTGGAYLIVEKLFKSYYLINLNDCNICCSDVTMEGIYEYFKRTQTHIHRVIKNQDILITDKGEE